MAGYGLRSLLAVSAWNLIVISRDLEYFTAIFSVPVIILSHSEARFDSLCLELPDGIIISHSTENGLRSFFPVTLHVYGRKLLTDLSVTDISIYKKTDIFMAISFVIDI